MTEREKILSLFNAAGESAGWKPGIGNYLVLNYLSHFAECVKADFLKSSGQYLTNDASREGCIKQAMSEAYEKAAAVCDNLAENGICHTNYPEEAFAGDCAEAIRQLKEQS